MLKFIVTNAVKFAVLIVSLFLCLSSLASAMSVNPVVVDLKSSGSQARSQINVINTLTYELPVEITISKISLSETGEIETVAVSGDNFLIFPPQALIQPGATQVFRVQWIGEPDLSESETYAFSVAQLPVELTEGVNGIQLLYNFQVVTNVAPVKGKPDLELLETDISVDDEGVAHPVLTVKNNGSAHGYLSATRLRLEMRDGTNKKIWSETYEPTELAQSMGLGLVQPSKTRKITLPIDLPQSDGSLKVSFKYVGRQ